jgi:hypothetical protein
MTFTFLLKTDKLTLLTNKYMTLHFPSKNRQTDTPNKQIHDLHFPSKNRQTDTPNKQIHDLHFPGFVHALL